MTSRLSLSSVRVRLALWNVGVLAFVLIGLGIIFSVAIRAKINAVVDRRLSEKARHAQHLLDGPPAAFLRPSSPSEDAADPSGEMRPRVFDAAGQPVRLGDAPLDAAALRRAEAGDEGYTTIRMGRSDVRIYSMPIRRDGADGAIYGVAQAGYSLTPMYAEQGRVTGTLLYLIPVVLLIAGLGGAFLTDRALRPVRRISAAASRIETENLSHRLPVLGDDEFADLAETFNGMLARLEAGFARQELAFEQQRRFAADASHELRTPLTIIKANTSLALSGRRTETEYEKTLRAVDTAADRMTRIVQDLLLLARADAGQLVYPLAPTPLAEVLDHAAAPLGSLPGAPVHLDLPTAPLLILAHADSLTRLFSNLLENAVRHTPPEGSVSVSAEREGPSVVVTVTDTGAGIAPEHLPHVMERFYRVEAARSRTQGGTGLGLPICRSVAESHGGHLEIASTPGVGTTVRVTLQSADVSDIPQFAESALAAK